MTTRRVFDDDHKEAPGAVSRALLILLGHQVFPADRDQPGVSNFHLAVELDQPRGLSAVLGAVTFAADDENHGMLSLQLGKFPAFRRVVG